VTDHPLPTPVDLAGLVAYQPDAVVSRTVLKNASGSLTLFAFDQGQGLSEHTTPHEAAILVLDGAARVTVGSEEHAVGRGSYLPLPAGVPHALHADEAFKMLLMMLRQTAG